MPERAWIDAPDQDEPRGGVVLIDHRRHLAVEAHVGGAGRSRAHRPQQPRRAEAPEQDGIRVVLREHPVRAAVAERQDRFAAVLTDGLFQVLGDLVERVVPRRAHELALALRAAADGGKQQPILPVDPLIEAPHLGADVAARDFVRGAAVDLGDAAATQRDGERAGVRAVERAGRLDRGFRWGNSGARHRTSLGVRSSKFNQSSAQAPGSSPAQASSPWSARPAFVLTRAPSWISRRTWNGPEMIVAPSATALDFNRQAADDRRWSPG